MSIIAGRVVVFTTALLLALTGVAVAAPSGQYGGPTSQKVGDSSLRITLTVSGGALAEVQVGAIAGHGGGTCSVGAESIYDFHKGTVRIDGHGSFDGKLGDANGDSLSISGHIDGQTAAGSFEIKQPAVTNGPTACNSGSVTFTASAAGGQVKGSKYSGTVGPGYPINFRVSADGNAIERLAVGIEATCQPGAGNTAPVYDFGALRITAGMFSGSVFEQHGSTVSDRVRITGTFFGRIAVGEVTDLSHIKSLPDCTQSEPFTASAM